MHHSSTSTYVPNFIEIKETFSGRTNVRTYARMGHTHIWADRHLRPALLSRLCQRVDLKSWQQIVVIIRQPKKLTAVVVINSEHLTLSAQLSRLQCSQYHQLRLTSTSPSEPSQHSSLTAESRPSAATCPSGSLSTSPPTSSTHPGQGCSGRHGWLHHELSIGFKVEW